VIPGLLRSLSGHDTDGLVSLAVLCPSITGGLLLRLLQPYMSVLLGVYPLLTRAQLWRLGELDIEDVDVSLIVGCHGLSPPSSTSLLHT